MLTKEFLYKASSQEHLKELKSLYSKIPENYIKPNLIKSLAYFFIDISIISILFYFGYYALSTNNVFLTIIYTILQGSYFWSLFMIGHDCGHESFSSNKFINNLFGYISHSFLLVPFYSWKLSHHKHHSFHNNIDKDESHVAIPVKLLKNLIQKIENKGLLFKFYFIVFNIFAMLGLLFPFYLFDNNIFKNDGESHYDPKASIFKGSEKHIVLSTFLNLLILASLIFLMFLTSVKTILILYFIPWLIFNFWLYFVTYLQHMNNETFWFYQKDWTFLKGAFQTVDYDYGRFLGPVINFMHHNIQRYHVVHHLHFRIPHYNLKKVHEILLPEYKEVYNLKQNPLKNYVEIKLKQNFLFVKDQEENMKEYSLISAKKIEPFLKD